MTGNYVVCKGPEVIVMQSDPMYRAASLALAEIQDMTLGKKFISHYKRRDRRYESPKEITIKSVKLVLMME